MTTHSSVGVDDDFSTGKTAVALGAPNDETTSWVDKETGFRIEQFIGDHGLDDLFHFHDIIGVKDAVPDAAHIFFYQCIQ